MQAYVFPGQGAQFPGMGKDLYERSNSAKALFEQANEILGFSIANIMFDGSEEELKQTKVTQPAIFLHSVIMAKEHNLQPDMVAGHSLGEFSALVTAGALSFEDGLSLVSQRAQAMQKACEVNPSGMAAIIGLDDAVVEETCDNVSSMVIAANYNSPGQIVISGSNEGVDKAIEQLKAKGAKRALKLNVSGAFHSALMEPARKELESAINSVTFNKPVCSIYQNVNAKPATDQAEIKKNLISQLDHPVLWTQSVKNMIKDGADVFYEVGPGKVLQGLIKKIDRNVKIASV
jgi:[acyl-carrier-protein] S-malonyltransferase